VKVPENGQVGCDRVFEVFYDLEEVWSQESLDRFKAMQPTMKAYQIQRFGKEVGLPSELEDSGKTRS
jgi:hypothetical protein